MAQGKPNLTDCIPAPLRLLEHETAKWRRERRGTGQRLPVWAPGQDKPALGLRRP